MDVSDVVLISKQVNSMRPVSGTGNESNLYLFIENRETTIATALMMVAGSILSIIQDDVSAWNVLDVGRCHVASPLLARVS